METTHLGKASALPASPDEAALDYVPNPRPGELYLVRFAAPEYGVSPGQAAVIYAGDRMIGGGWIEQTFAAEPVAA